MATLLVFVGLKGFGVSKILNSPSLEPMHGFSTKALFNVTHFLGWGFACGSWLFLNFVKYAKAQNCLLNCAR